MRKTLTIGQGVILCLWAFSTAALAERNSGTVTGIDFRQRLVIIGNEHGIKRYPLADELAIHGSRLKDLHALGPGSQISFETNHHGEIQEVWITSPEMHPYRPRDKDGRLMD